jgi:Uma2 family endonuclease
MNLAVKTELLSVEEYLACEEVSQIRHEYLGGVVYAMAGGTQDHNTISLNLAAALKAKLRGGPCRVFMADMQTRIDATEPPIFYYPDVIVGCDPRDKNQTWLLYPKVVFEVLSESTERTDRGEKFSNYVQVPSLEDYVLVAQDYMEVTIFARNRNWEPQVIRFPEQLLELKSLGVSIRLAEVYEGTQAGA